MENDEAAPPDDVATAESVPIPAWAVFVEGLDPGAFRTWCALAVYASTGDFPAVETMARRLGIHRSTMVRQLDDLEARGLVHRYRRPRARGGYILGYELAQSYPLGQRRERGRNRESEQRHLISGQGSAA